MAEQQEVTVVPAGPQGSTQMQFRPHRGVLILVLGILGIVCCFICGIIAWVMGSNDLKEMAAGRMDPSGQGLTQAGKICGMVSVILQILVIVIWLVFMAIGIGSAGMRGM